MAQLKPWEVAAAERGVPVQRAGVFIPKSVDPYKGKADARADSELDLKRQGLAFKQQQAREAQALRREAMELRKRAAQIGPKMSPQAEKKMIGDQAVRSDLGTIEKQLGRVESLYNKNFKGVGPGSLLEYLSTPTRRQFDSSNELLSTMIKPLIRGPGEGAWTDADQRKLDSLVLSGGRLDADNEERIRGIKMLVEGRKVKHGVPEKGWTVKRIK